MEVGWESLGPASSADAETSDFGLAAEYVGIRDSLVKVVLLQELQLPTQFKIQKAMCLKQK